MDVWLKSGFLIPCMRLMWLSSREGRGKLGLSSVQYLWPESPRERTGYGPAWLQGRESPRQRAGWAAQGSPEKASWRASYGGRQQQGRTRAPALGRHLTLHSPTPLPGGPSASREEARLRPKAQT